MYCLQLQGYGEKKEIVLHPPTMLQGKFGGVLWSPNGQAITDSK